MKRFFTIFLLFIYFTTNIFSQNFIGKFPKHEVRAVWLTSLGNLDWPKTQARNENTLRKQQKELQNILDSLQNIGINTVLFQTRIRGTVAYPSKYEPWDYVFSGKPGVSPQYDILKFVIDECHKRGMELHAWIVTIPIGKRNAIGARKIREKRNTEIYSIKNESYLDPRNKHTAKYIADICGEIVQNYDVDGIHLDYIRYPENWKINFDKSLARKQITEIVKATSNRIKSIKKWVKLSCSPIGKYKDVTCYSSFGWNAYDKCCQDAQGWLEAGYMDEIYPMMYFRGNQFYPFALNWQQENKNRTVVPGLGIYFLSSKDKNWPLSTITEELYFLRNNNLGQAFFRSDFLTTNTKGLASFLQNKFYLYPALTNTMTWYGYKHPTPPTTFTLKENNLSWDGAIDHSDGNYLTYNLYGSYAYPINISDAKNLIIPNIHGKTIKIAANDEKFYAITAMDRYGNESQPLEITKPNKNLSKDAIITYKDFTSHVQSLNFDIHYVLIETVEGNIIDSFPIDQRTRFQQIPNGTFILKGINKRGIIHKVCKLIK